MSKKRMLWQQRPNVEQLKASGDLTPDLDRIVREGYESLTGEDYYRLKMVGVCGQNTEGVHMMRVRIPGGVATCEQLARVADIAGSKADGTLHVTTRTNIELHGVPTSNLLEVLESLHEVGLTTRSACGHTIRNVLGCPAAGICAEEVLDTRPHVQAVHDVVIAKSAEHNAKLPRRLNVSFGGCGDCSRHAQVNDIGFVGVAGPGRGPGYAIWIAGSLATNPRVSLPLCSYVEPDDAVTAVEAIIDIYAEHGFRDNRGRLKYLVEDWGIERFRDEFARQFEDRTGRRPVFGEPIMPDAGEASTSAVLPQRQPDRFRVRVAIPLGDLTVDQAYALVTMARAEGDGTVRFSAEQNAEIAWVAGDRVARVLTTLSDAGLGAFGAGDISDVRACPGTTHCVLAHTDSQGVSTLIGDAFRSAPLHDEAVRRMRVHVSGCANSCVQHQAADIGMAGCRLKIDGEIREAYQVFVGGRLGSRVRMADRIGRVDARRTVDLVDALVDLYVSERSTDEAFADVVDRVGPRAVADHVAEWLGGAFIPSLEQEQEEVSV